MPFYHYAARGRDGKAQAGSQEADSEDAAVRLLQGRGLLVTRIGLSLPGRSRSIKRHSRVRGSDLLVFTQELSTLLSSGVALLRALDIVSTQIQSERLFEAVNAVKIDIQSGATFKDAVARQKAFPALWTHIIEAGEVSGNLPLVLNDMARNQERGEELKKKVISAMIYPGVLICVAIGAVSIFVLKIIPIFAGLFANFKAELPLLTRMVIKMSDVFRVALPYAVVAGFAASYFLRRYFATPAGRENLDRWVLATPVFGPLVQDAVLARVALNFSILVKSGVNFLKSLEIAARASGNAVFEKSILKIRDQVQEGAVLSEAMGRDPLFSGMIVQMIQVGEEVGKLEEMMAKVGVYYEDRVNTFVNRLSTLIEPVILLVVGVVIGILVIAMFLPIFSISSLIG